MISIEYHNQIAVLSLNRPEKAHAYDRTHLLELKSCIEELSNRASIVVVRSVGHRAFCAGADLSGMSHPDPISALSLLSQTVFTSLAQAPFVSIASVHGAAVAGGCELTLACDLRVAGPDARFELPETKLGLIPAAGGCTRLVQLIGLSRAKALILGGESLTAQQAFHCGLVHRLSDRPFQESLAWASSIKERSGSALKQAKKVLNNPSLHLERWSEGLLYAAKMIKNNEEES